MRKKNSFIPDLKFAMENSKNNDSNQNYYFPKKMETKVYELFESLMNKVSKDDFISFINKLNN